MALIMSYENNEVKPKKVYRVLSCVLYSLIKIMFLLTIYHVNQKPEALFLPNQKI